MAENILPITDAGFTQRHETINIHQQLGLQSNQPPQNAKVPRGERMNSKETSGINTEFRIQDPIQVFDTFSQEEMERRSLTDPEFDIKSYQEAKELVLTRLRINRVGKENLA